GAAPGFRHQELQSLAALEAHLARVLRPRALPAAGGEILDSGLAVATPAGRLQWTSAEAGELMQQAFGWRWRGATQALPGTVRAMLRRLDASGCPGEPQQLNLCTAKGWFSLRATRMEATSGTRKAVALQIARHAA